MAVPQQVGVGLVGRDAAPADDRIRVVEVVGPHAQKRGKTPRQVHGVHQIDRRGVDPVVGIECAPRDAAVHERIESADHGAVLVVDAIAVAETTRAAAPDMALGSISFPGTLFAGRHHYAALMRGATPLTERLVKPVLIDAQTGALTAARALPWYVTALLVSQPLHFGDYSGLPLKILWAALDVITILVLVSGLYLWSKRRNPLVKDRARAVAVDTPAGAAGRRGPARHGADMGSPGRSRERDRGRLALRAGRRRRGGYAVLGGASRAGRHLCAGGVQRVQVIRAVRSACFRHPGQAIGRITGRCSPGDASG